MAPRRAEQSRGCNNDVSKNTRNPLLWKGIFYTGGYERRPDEEGIETAVSRSVSEMKEVRTQS